ncbi:hypothetical protein EE612_023366, partial [Oryza sativa]
FAPAGTRGNASIGPCRKDAGFWNSCT